MATVSVAVSINPKDSSDFDLQYHFQKLPVSMFNPYIISSTSFPLDRGTLEFNGFMECEKRNDTKAIITWLLLIPV